MKMVDISKLCKSMIIRKSIVMLLPYAAWELHKNGQLSGIMIQKRDVMIQCAYGIAHLDILVS